VFQQSCFSIYVSAVVFQQSCFSIYVSSSVIQQLCFSIHVPAVVFQQSCSSNRVSASVTQPTSVFALVLQRLCSHFVLQHLCTLLCYSICDRICVSASVYQRLCSSISSVSCACSINNRLPSMTTLTICVSFCDPALFQHCVSASVFAFAFVLQHLCCSICVLSLCVPTSFSINNRLPSMTTLIMRMR
jgi:hypothetical protein